MVFEDGERNALIKQLGLADDADENTLAEAVSNRLKAQAAPTPPARPSAPEADPALAAIPQDADVVTIDVAEFQRLRQRDNVADEVEKAMAVRDRDELVEEAIHDGKISPARREHYKKKYDKDPESTKMLLGSLLANTVPVKERGKDAPTDEVDQTSYPQDWVPEAQARVAAAQPPQPGQPAPVRVSRIHGEV
jgi:hypothetical protein